MCREITSDSNKAVSPPLRTPCAPVPRSHCTLASKCKHFRFAVDEPCCPRVAHFAFEVTLSLAIMLALLLVCSFSPKVQSIFWGPHILKKRIKMMCCFCCMGQFMGENPTERLADGKRLRFLALLCVFDKADCPRGLYNCINYTYD